MKKILSLVLVLMMVLSFAGCQKEKSIGTITGAEYESMVIGDQHYRKCEDAPFHRADKDQKIGRIQNGDDTFHIYSVKGTDQYLYCRREWEGWMYQAVPGDEMK